MPEPIDAPQGVPSWPSVPSPPAPSSMPPPPPGSPSDRPAPAPPSGWPPPAPPPGSPAWSPSSLAPPAPGPPAWLGVLVLAVGVVAGLAFVLGAAMAPSGSEAGAVVAASGRSVVPLDGNRTYLISIDDPDVSAARDAPDIQIIDPSGVPVPLSDAEQGTNPYLQDVATFLTPMAGTYTVVVGDPPDGRAMHLVIGEPSSVLDWTMVAFIVAILGTLAGIVLLVVGTVRRRAARAAWAPPEVGGSAAP